MAYGWSDGRQGAPDSTKLGPGTALSGFKKRIDKTAQMRT
jgi:hypothetical protein